MAHSLLMHGSGPALRADRGADSTDNRRIYRGSKQGHGLSFVAEGGPAEAADIHAYIMESIWTEVADMPAKEKELSLPN